MVLDFSDCVPIGSGTICSANRETNIEDREKERHISRHLIVVAGA